MFEMVSTCGAEVVPTLCGPNVRLSGDIAITGVIPVPISGMLGLIAALV